ncbi:MAG: hypothetical protein RSD90_03440 [Anaerovoracaceae bacterium]
MKKKRLTRQWAKSGFTISEMLMAVLILSLIIIIIGGGVVVVKNSYQTISLKAEAEVLISTTITKVTDEFRFAKNVESGIGVAPASFESGNSKYRMTFANKPDGIYTISTVGNYEIPLLTDKTMTSKLIPTIEYSFDESTKLFNATITIKYQDKEYTKQAITIKPINI